MLDALGLPADGVPAPAMRRQSDERSAGWAERYRAESGARRVTAAAGAPRVPQLRALEAEAVYVMREVAAEFERPVLLFSGGKDSIVLLRAGREGVPAGAASRSRSCTSTPGHNFPEVLEFRDRRVRRAGRRS